MPRPLRTIAAVARPFTRLPSVPELSALEQEILEFWQRERVFDRLREQNADGPRFSFFDGPVTANKTMGVHTAWGRTLKDVFLRYKALRGYHQRYQNGWDCQGLWIEVAVEKSLGMNSKTEIEEYGLDKFAAKMPRRRRLVLGGTQAGVRAARTVDGLGTRPLPLQRHKLLGQLALLYIGPSP